MATVVLGLLCALGVVAGSPVKTYDQRQQGELNIHAQLDNIVIVLIPTSKISLMGADLPSTDAEVNLVTSSALGEKPTGDKNGFLQFLQKHIKNDIDRYDVVKEDHTSAHTEKENEVASQSQQVVLNHVKENVKEEQEEVVATVEEMKPETTEKTTDPPKYEPTEIAPVKEHSTLSESVQQTVIKISIPDELKDAVKKAEEETKKEIEDAKLPETVKEPPPYLAKLEDVRVKPETTKKDQTPVKPESSKTNKEGSVKEPSKHQTPQFFSLDALIKPVAEKKPELPSVQAGSTNSEKGDTRRGPTEGGRREKVIRYKPESKWAPGLVDLLGPVRSRGLDLEERQKFNPLCSPGVWDPELKTCILPGETRSRNELARFLEAMRFGIAIPAQ